MSSHVDDHDRAGAEPGPQVADARRTKEAFQAGGTVDLSEDCVAFPHRAVPVVDGGSLVAVRRLDQVVGRAEAFREIGCAGAHLVGAGPSAQCLGIEHSPALFQDFDGTVRVVEFECAGGRGGGQRREL
ncbi:hypothetical protein JNW88_25690 [Micromonospora sp. ATA32]|nr:hypothetical protein [Micromonospora sp. ATA32]